MAKGLVPSEIVTFIDRYFPEAKTHQATEDHSASKVHPDQSGVLKALVEMIEKLDEALLPADAQELADLRLALNHIRFWTALWEGGRSKDTLPFIPQSGRKSAVVTLRRILENCTETPTPAESEERLSFVADPEYRKRFVADLQEVESGLSHGEWKSATVLGGSLIEALLLEALSGSSGKLSKSNHYTALQGHGQKKKGLEWWDLNDYLQVALEVGVIGQSTYDLGMKARDFRNLVHPGKEQREKMKCTRATALTVRAALEHVIEDLSRLRHSSS